MIGISIGEAAKLSGVKIPTIRFYEEIALLRPTARTEANRRLFTDEDPRRLSFIRHCRELGFELDAIRALLKVQDSPKQSCDAADAIARQRLDEVERRLRSLKALKKELTRMIEGCGHGRVGQCRVIETLADHAKCVTPRH
ncbi:MerR family transcriptional regulator [Hyphomicrobium denitrificans 1NES1]|uniref:MerR family transcriptional regulator n=1 Tax=Hyphomicrobium denitrificans 1NES1 TaxID=670307 RepID=N0B0G1_9HYPH|nr:helix-turn-helix domain-containing protein [Hyphomicrobium denitrificans]AGK56388.1 MerR family transcriptional regulator [Hyphomicrobium denitrificans 1NES1]